MILGGEPFNPGQLRTAVAIQTRSVSVETGGFPTPTFTTLATVRAKWINVHGSEAWAAAAAQGGPGPEAAQAATVTMRYRADVDVTCALLKGTTRYEIVSMDNIQERNELLELKVQRMRAG